MEAFEKHIFSTREINIEPKLIIIGGSTLIPDENGDVICSFNPSGTVLIENWDFENHIDSYECHYFFNK